MADVSPDPVPTARADLAVVGAGPAGMAAAAAAAAAGVDVVWLDAGERIGGQYWRHRPQHPPADPRRARLADAIAAHVRRGRIAHASGHSVVAAIPSDHGTLLVCTRPDGAQVRVDAAALVMATGAHDRVLPFPGWDLPGVMTAGGAQILAKVHGVAPGRRVVVAGAGPFLAPVALSLAGAGTQVACIAEAGAPTTWLRRPITWDGALAKAPEALRLAAGLAGARIPVRTRTAVVAAHGDQVLEGVTLADLDADWHIVAGSERLIDCDTVAVGFGFTPQVDLAIALGARTHLDADASLVATVDTHQRTTAPGVWAAGEIAGVGGADLALVEGHLAGLSVAATLVGDHGASARTVARLLARRGRLRRAADGLAAVHGVRDGWRTWLTPQTTVCRCEEVPAQAVTTAVDDLGATGPRDVKLLARPGMGWCQGRICGWPTAGLVAGGCGRPVTADDLRDVTRRTFAVPIRMGALAAADRPDPPPTPTTDPRP